MSIGKDLTKGHSYVCSDSDVLTDEFNLSSFQTIKENVIVRVSAEGIEDFPV
jgi:hypothetical protein